MIWVVSGICSLILMYLIYSIKSLLLLKCICGFLIGWVIVDISEMIGKRFTNKKKVYN